MSRVIAIAAMDEGRVIGADNGLPWHLPADLKRFSECTSGNVVLMGRKTYESLPDKYRPLPNRINVVLSREIQSLAYPPEVLLYSDPLVAITALRQSYDEDIWVIGGGEIYRHTLELWDEVYLTVVKGRYNGDTYFPVFENNFREVAREDHADFSFLRYKSTGKNEVAY